MHLICQRLPRWLQVGVCGWVEPEVEKCPGIGEKKIKYLLQMRFSPSRAAQINTPNPRAGHRGQKCFAHFRKFKSVIVKGVQKHFLSACIQMGRHVGEDGKKETIKKPI